MVKAITLWGSVLSALGAGAAMASPAVWHVPDADGLVTIVGCIHALPAGLAWDADSILSAVDQADAVYIESYTGPEVVENLRPLVKARGLYADATRLSDVLAASDLALLEEQVVALSLDRAKIMRQRPWMAALSVSMAQGKRVGWKRSSGLDSRIAAAARAQGKPVRALEDARDVISALADLPPEAAIAYLRDQLTRDAADQAQMETLVAAWARGDLVAVEALAVRAVQNDNPDLHAALYTQRNPAMADRVAALIEAPGVAVVAMGAGHTVGSDGVIARVRAMGYIVDGP